MRRIVAGMFVSLDGVMESPERWNPPYFDAEMGAAIGASMAGSDAMLMGRVTYQEWVGYWPAQGDDNEMAGYMNGVPKFVVSTTLDTVEWRNSTLVNGNVPARIAALKAQPGKDIAISGSATLVRSLLRDGLLDELRLMVHPVVLGHGRRLFEPDGGQASLKLVDTTAFGSGVVSLTYVPATA